MGIILTVTAKGQVPDERVQAGPHPGKPVSNLFGRLHRPGERALTIEELKEEAEAGWAGER